MSELLREVLDIPAQAGAEDYGAFEVNRDAVTV
jgi:hypothetical protein